VKLVLRFKPVDCPVAPVMYMVVPELNGTTLVSIAVNNTLEICVYTDPVLRVP